MIRLIDPTTPPAAQPAGGAGWRLAMSEEFNGQAVDTGNGHVTFRPSGPAWRAWYWDDFLTKLGGQNPHTNNPALELQYYDTPALTTVDGALRITATKNPPAPILNPHPGFTYTSGLIQSKDFFTPTYGAFEARMRLPGGDFEWPAFWLFASDYPDVPYHELDVMECFGSSTEVFSTVHGPAGYKVAQRKTLPSVEGWHTYGMVWTSTYTSFLVDGTEILRDTGAVPHVPMMLILNLAAGTNYGTGRPDTMITDIDYIRAWT